MIRVECGVPCGLGVEVWERAGVEVVDDDRLDRQVGHGDLLSPRVVDQLHDVDRALQRVAQRLGPEGEEGPGSDAGGSIWAGAVYRECRVMGGGEAGSVAHL